MFSNKSSAGQLNSETVVGAVSSSIANAQVRMYHDGTGTELLPLPPPPASPLSLSPQLPNAMNTTSKCASNHHHNQHQQQQQQQQRPQQYLEPPSVYRLTPSPVSDLSSTLNTNSGFYSLGHDQHNNNNNNSNNNNNNNSNNLDTQQQQPITCSHHSAAAGTLDETNKTAAPAGVARCSLPAQYRHSSASIDHKSLNLTKFSQQLQAQNYSNSPSTANNQQNLGQHNLLAESAPQVHSPGQNLGPTASSIANSLFNPYQAHQHPPPHLNPCQYSYKQQHHHDHHQQLALANHLDSLLAGPNRSELYASHVINLARRSTGYRHNSAEPASSGQQQQQQQLSALRFQDNIAQPECGDSQKVLQLSVGSKQQTSNNQPKYNYNSQQRPAQIKRSSVNFSSLASSSLSPSPRSQIGRAHV